MNISLIDAALSYAAMRWKVFPLQPGTKIPYSGTRGVKDATDDEDTIRSWWTVHPDANIALACGEPSNVWVVDVDVGHKAGVDGFASLASRGIDLPETLYQDTPSGGRHYLYKLPEGAEPPKNKNGFLPGIDIRGTGYYIVIAPSVVNGKQYVMSNDSMTRFPASMYPKDRTEMPWEKKRPAPAPAPVSIEHVGSLTVVERARMYLQQCEPAIQGMGGHNALLWAAQALVVGFELDDVNALEILWSEFNPRCQPPWNPSSRRDKRDFERKVTEARNHPVKERGWLLKETNFNVADDALDFAGTALAEAFLGQNRPNVEPESATVEVKPAPEDGETDVEAVVSRLPDEILNPPGLVGDIARYINETAGCWQPVFALGASLAFCGALFGRKVKDESNGRTNIYCMGVGHSSAGKDHPTKCIARIIQAARIEPILGGEVTSDTAIEICLKESPTKLFMMDEVGHFLRTINQAGGGTPHLKTIVPMFMKMFSSANSLYVGKQRVTGGPANQIDQPCVCIWGVTSPQILFDNMTREELEGGWTARNLVFISETRPEYQFTKETKVPDSIATMVNAWHLRQIPPPEKDNAFSVMKAHQIVVPTNAEAREVFREFGHEAHAKMLKADKSGDVCNYLWGKAMENARRIALIVACGEHYDNAEICVPEAQYGCRLVKYLIDRLTEAVHNNVAETGWERDKQRILKVISRAETAGMSKSELTRKTQWIRNSRCRNEYIQDLCEAGLAIMLDHAPMHGNRPWIWAVKWLPKAQCQELIDLRRAELCPAKK